MNKIINLKNFYINIDEILFIEINERFLYVDINFKNGKIVTLNIKEEEIENIKKEIINEGIESKIN